MKKNKKDNPFKGLSFLYNTIIGRLILKLLVSSPLISKIVGFILNRRISVIFIKPFIKKNKINMNDYIETKYKSFNDFFTRKIKKEKRPVDGNENNLISPCDSKLTCYEINEDLIFNVKNSKYSLESMLDDKSLAEKYKNGLLLVFRLSPEDYHRYHFIDDGKFIKKYNIKGKLHTVNPIVYDKYEVFKENSREVSILDTKNFNEVIYVEVGALLVGKIKNIINKGKFKKKDIKGYFEFGGSTVILVIKKGIININDNIIENSKKGIETIVKYGQTIGKKKN